MGAMYNFSWDSSGSDHGINRYNLVIMENGNQVYNSDVYGNGTQMTVSEGANIHAEVRAICNCGAVGDAATMDFTAETRVIDPPVCRPSLPGNFRADFQGFN